VRYAIAVDLGGTKIAAAIVNENGEVMKQRNILTQANLGKKTVMDNMVSVISDLMSSKTDTEITGIGVGIPGFADAEGKVLFMPNVPLVGVNMRTVLEKRFKLPVCIENDSNCFAMGEYFFGGHKSKVLLGVIVGTGIGSGIVSEGHLIRGSQGGAGELGHILFDNSQKKTVIGKNDFEAVCSGPNLAEKYFKMTGTRIHPKRIFVIDDSSAKNVIDEEYDHLGKLLAVAVDMLNPDTIVMGGGVSRSLSSARLKKAVEQYAIPFSAKHVKIACSELGEKAGLLGAAALVF
jgi:glucokinase